MNYGFITLRNIDKESNIVSDSVSSFFLPKLSFKHEVSHKLYKTLQAKSFTRGFVRNFGVTHTQPISTEHCDGDYHLHIDAFTRHAVLLSRGSNKVFEGHINDLISQFKGEVK
ncbi:hypothetical protein OPW39_15650 [Vibrio europaeus]|uniref:hypothetical protein n=1 Tax=Vibrio europaeus TaxID=300876 RepID=UPI00233F3DD9|nr:hypothetical protein [Vibrio europaeus]MDC5870242.1 hypothetical protein [Vibrio europaeus]